MNPNNCETCKYREINEGLDGWCYMFFEEPIKECKKHTGLTSKNDLEFWNILNDPVSY